MKYKIELVKNSKIIYSHSENATHPNQVIRRAVSKFNTYNYFIYMISESGTVWIYYLDKMQRVKKVTKGEIVGIELDYIKSGNKSIYEVIEQ